MRRSCPRRSGELRGQRAEQGLPGKCEVLEVVLNEGFHNFIRGRAVGWKQNSESIMKKKSLKHI